MHSLVFIGCPQLTLMLCLCVHLNPEFVSNEMTPHSRALLNCERITFVSVVKWMYIHSLAYMPNLILAKRDFLEIKQGKN